MFTTCNWHSRQLKLNLFFSVGRVGNSKLILFSAAGRVGSSNLVTLCNRHSRQLYFYLNPLSGEIGRKYSSHFDCKVFAVIKL